MMSTMHNPLLQPWGTPHAMPPFASIKVEHFAPALKQAMVEHRAELDAIAIFGAEPTFDNTVAAMDASGKRYKQLVLTFENLTASHTSPALQQVERDMAQPMAAHKNAIYMHAALFKKIDVLHQSRASLALDRERLRMLERVHLDFVRAGAQLQGASQRRFAAIQETLAQLSTQFGQNVLADENGWHLTLRDESDFAGLPEFVRDAAHQAAAERGLEGHVIALTRSIVVPFLTFSERRDAREKVWRAYTSRGEHTGPTDNRPLVREMLRLRAELAALLGYASYADYSLADKMAQSQAGVSRLLDDVWSRAKQALDVERAQLLAVKREAGDTQPLEPWDWRYWAEKVRQRTYALDDAETKPYFSLDSMVAAAFDCATQLFGVTFHARADLPTYHADVKAYEVRDASTQAMVGIFLQDNFSRPSKRSGAWMSAFRWQSRNHGGVTPIIVNNNNFNKAPPGEPTLLSADDVRTLFHEFGHGLHGLLSNVSFERLSGTNVLDDFVELPSQLFEHWATQPEVLRKHARHVITQAPIPDALIDRLHKARNFGQGFETVRYVASSLTDMAVHAQPLAQVPDDVVAFEAQVLSKQGLPPGVGINHRFTHFQHLFSGSSYAAGYYVYLWAEVLDADAFAAFEEAGNPFDAATAKRLKQNIYSVGDSVEPGETYKAFRGRAATVDAMLRKRGLLLEAHA